MGEGLGERASGTYTVSLQDAIGRQSSVAFGVIRDTTPPTLTLEAPVRGTDVHVTWNVEDSGSGMDASTCLLEVREDEGAWQTFSTECGGEDATHDGEPGHTYTFRLSASDNVGNEDSLEVQAVVPYVTKYYYANGQRVATWQGDVVYYVHTDHLGSTSVLSDESGQRAGDRVAYLPYGGVRLGDASTLPTDYGFTGQRLEAGIGLMHYGARFYSPRLGRFASADTIVPNPLSPQDFNRYSYVSNNPLRYRDPTGHQNWDAVSEFFMGVVYQIGANNYEALGVSSVAAVRAGAEEVAQEHSDSMAFEAGRLCGSLGTALQGLGEIEGGLAAAEAGATVSGTGVGALVGVPVAVAGVAVAGHGTVLVGQSVGQAALSAGRLIQMASKDTSPAGRPDYETNGKGFASPEKLTEHFKKHRAEFGYKTAEEYLQGAQKLVSGGEGIETFTRTNGDTLFYKAATNEFAVLSNEGTIRTYFKPVEGLDYWLSQIGGR